ncbi:hypothetical protein V1512DRAFT_276800 [Lipomyces arxii]|uniref:uncharacterized protein n=1 Tax=Lipomyces arxii TaxID=56418 RepID=UPI0034CD1847
MDKSVVDQVVDMGFSREDAEFALKQSNNNVERAIEYIFSGKIHEDRVKNEWNEAQFTQTNWDSQGPILNENETSAFAPDTFYNEGEATSTNNRPSSQMMDHGKPFDEDEMDENMAKAMQMSLDDLSASQLDLNYNPSVPVDRRDQESGVVFGPATQDHYDSSQWGMTTLQNQSTNFPEYKSGSWRRDPNTPPVLRPLTQAGSLTQLLMILHSIPLVRASMLLFGHKLVGDYGIAVNWWDKELIYIPAFAESNLENKQIKQLMLLVESQRIMAFLDTHSESERSYCSIENLMYSLIDSDFMQKYGPLAGFMKSWSSVAGQYAEILQLPKITDLHGRLFDAKAALGSEQAVEDDGEFTSLDLVVSDIVRNTYRSLVGVLDDLLWSEEPDAYLSAIGYVFTIAIRQENGLPGSGLDLPLEWYPDRYTKPFKQVMKVRNQRRVEVLDAIEELRERRYKIVKFANYDTQSLVHSSINYFEAKTTASPGQAKSDGTASTLDKLKTLSTTLRGFVSRIDAKIEFLEQQIRGLTEFMSGPPAEDDEAGQVALKEAFNRQPVPKFHKYLLAGVIISDSTVYFRQRRTTAKRSSAEPPSILDDQDGIDERQEQEEAVEYIWYHYDYFGGTVAGAFEIRQVNAEQVVLAAATTGDDGVIALYADAKAYESEEDATAYVNEALRDFLVKDNELLKTELNGTIGIADLITLDNHVSETPVLSSMSSSVLLAANDSDVEMLNDYGLVTEIKEPSDVDSVVEDDTVLVENTDALSTRTTSSRSIGSTSALPRSGGDFSEEVSVGENVLLTGKARVMHAEHADEQELFDSDEDMLNQMRRK